MTRELNLDQALEVARRAAKAAGALAMGYFRGRLEVEQKADASPVTVADREAETAIRDILGQAYPEHAVYGEEFGRDGDHACMWLIDPIDGTRSFIRGLEFWSVQIGLMIDGQLVLGVSAAPAFNETAWAVSGRGAFLDGAPIAVSGCTTIERMDLSLGNVRSLAGGPGWTRLAGLVRRAARTRGYGDFYPYHRLAAGALDAVIESNVNILDIAALAVIVTEAGGVMTDLQGQPVGLDTSSVLAAAPALHPVLLSSLQ